MHCPPALSTAPGIDVCAAVHRDTHENAQMPRRPATVEGMQSVSWWTVGRVVVVD